MLMNEPSALVPGGLMAVIYTDALQTLIMVVGALVLMFLGKQVVTLPSHPKLLSGVALLEDPAAQSFVLSSENLGSQWGDTAVFLTVSVPTGFQEVGWYPGLQERYRLAIPNVTVPNTTCHLPWPDAFHMLRDPVSGDIPWPGLIFGLTVLATWCWCTDQVMPPGQPIRKHREGGHRRHRGVGLVLDLKEGSG